MIIKPSIRSNFFTNSHPLGIKRMMDTYVAEVKKLDKFQGPKNVLIIGGSSGYGLATRLTLAFSAGANTINVSFENQGSASKTGSAGYWNNLFFQDAVKDLNQTHLDFNGDAFSPEMKAKVLETIQEKFGKIDLLVYSLASGARKNFETGDLIRSAIKPIGKPAEGKTIDIKSLTVEPLTVEPATEEEVKNTVFVMGGSDWYDWVKTLEQAGVLNEGFKTISYTYVGGKNTDNIYRSGTIGKAKEDLEATVIKMDQVLKPKYHGEALISSSKAIVSKASVFIPQMPIYVSYLFDVMTKNHTHETTLEHKHRLFKDMVYGNKRLLDDLGRIRIDHKEMEASTQKIVADLMHQSEYENFLELPGTKLFLTEFYQINGFSVPGVDEEQEVDLETLITKYHNEKYQNV